MNDFVADAISNEIKRRQKTEPAQELWETVAQMQEEIQSEELALNPDEIWGDSRSPSLEQ